jgi:hypothetical protein
MLKIKSAMPRMFFPLICVFLMAFDQPKLVKTKVADGISVSIPKDWRAMDGMDFSERYPSVRAPLAAFTNNERLSDFSVNISATQWPDADLEIAQQFFKSSINNMFDKVEWIGEGIHEVHGKKYIYFEFESRVNGNKQQEGYSDPVMRYTYLQYLVQPKRTLVFSFNCPRRERENWQPTARSIMKSITVK